MVQRRRRIATPPLDHLREVAARHRVDYRTVLNELRYQNGEREKPVRGTAGDRAREALKELTSG